MKNALNALCFGLVLALSSPLARAEAEYPPQTIGAEMRCPVCGMYPARYPKWMTEVVFKDRSLAAFDSPLELVRFIRDLPRYDKTHLATDIGAIYVTDFGKGTWIEARTAVFVQGSKQRGPMNGDELPAFANRADALAFAQQHGGHLIGFDQIVPPSHHHKH